MTWLSLPRKMGFFVLFLMKTVISCSVAFYFCLFILFCSFLSFLFVFVFVLFFVFCFFGGVVWLVGWLALFLFFFLFGRWVGGGGGGGVTNILILDICTYGNKADRIYF